MTCQRISIPPGGVDLEIILTFPYKGRYTFLQTVEGKWCVKKRHYAGDYMWLTNNGWRLLSKPGPSIIYKHARLFNSFAITARTVLRLAKCYKERYRFRKEVNEFVKANNSIGGY